MGLFNKRILSPHVRPSSRQISHLAVFGIIIYPPLTPTPPAIDQLKALTTPWVKRVDYSEALFRLVRMGCSAHPRANIRPRQLRNREVPWEGSHGSKLMSRRTERPYKVDGAGRLAQHSEAPCSVPEINGPVVQREFTFLLRETCSPGPPATAGAAASNGRRAGTGVSRGRSTESNEPGNTGGPHNS